MEAELKTMGEGWGGVKRHAGLEHLVPFIVQGPRGAASSRNMFRSLVSLLPLQLNLFEVMLLVQGRRPAGSNLFATLSSYLSTAYVPPG